MTKKVDKKQMDEAVKEAQEPINVVAEVKKVLKQKGLTLVKTDELQKSLVAKSQKTDAFNPIVWDQFSGMAKTMIESGAMPDHITTPAQAMVVMQAGYEMGMKPMQSINSLYIVGGHVTIWGKAITLQFRKHGYKLSFKDKKNETTVIATHKNGDVYKEIFTFEEAEKSGYTRSKGGKLKFGWKEGANRNIKLRYNAMNKLAKTQCADVLEGAVGVTEVYKDAVEIQEGEVVSDQPLDKEFVKSINKARNQKELIGICKNIKSDINADYHEALEAEYTRKKLELEEVK